MATYYIATTGNDSTGNGSSGTPWATFAKFLASSASGDTCVARAGTYTWTTATLTNRNLQNYTGETVIFDGAGAQFAWTHSGTVAITGVAFQNAIGNSSSFDCAGTTTTFANCSFSNVSNDGVGYNGGLFRIYGASASLTLTNCVFNDIKHYASGGNAGKLISGGSNAQTVAITGCTFYTSATGTSQLSYIVTAWAANVNLTIKNCIFYNATGGTITWGSNGNGGSVVTTATYSDFYLITSNPTGTGVITSSPLFVDAASSNFRLRPTSPCLNTGSAV